MSTSDALQLIQSLPQRSHIPDDVATEWVRSTIKADPGRLMWHVRRAFGIGGSEAGAAVAHYSGEYTLTNAAHVVRSKLLMNSPKDFEGTRDTMRGIALERFADEAFLTKFSATVDTKSEEILRQAFEQGSDSKPWQRPNVDRIALIRRNGSIRRYLVDYKAPRSGTAETYSSAGIPLEYDCQLHYYASCCEDRGIDLDGIILSPFDCDLWDVLPVQTLVNRDRINEVNSACDKLWREHVLLGSIPRPEAAIPSKEFQPTEPMMEAAMLFGAFMATNKASESYSEGLKKKLSAFAAGLGMGSATKCIAGPVNITGTESMVYDELYLKMLAEKYNVDYSVFESSKVVMDTNGLAAAVKAAVPENEFARAGKSIPGFRIAITQKKSGYQHELWTSLKAKAADTIKDVAPALLDFQSDNADLTLVTNNTP